MKKPLIFCWLLFCLVARESSGQQTNYGVAVAGVSFAVAITNNVININSNTFIRCWVKNAAGQSILLAETGALEDDFASIVLTSASGERYDLRPHVPMRVTFRNVSINVAPNETYERLIQVPRKKDLRRGSYDLQITRKFAFVNGGTTGPFHVVESNVLRVTAE